MSDTRKIIETITVKQTVIKAIGTRLKPNVYNGNHPFWASLSNGLNKMSIGEINALEALIIGKKIPEDKVIQELFGK